MTLAEPQVSEVRSEAGTARSVDPESTDSAPRTEQQLRAITIGEPTRQTGSIAIAKYDVNWPRLFALEAKSLHATLGDRVLLVEHVGSTSVPGLAAKPWIDMLLVVADSTEEQTYAPVLETAGYTLRIREPDWYGHRMFHRTDPDVNLHVFSPACPEVDRMLRFRDHLRDHDADRRLYERTKRELAGREWTFLQDYADAKSAVITDILARAGTR